MKTYTKAKNGYMVASDGSYEHRNVWAAAHGVIPADCHIHHRNKIRHDNRLENLECLNSTEHLRIHGLSWTSLNALRKARSGPKRRFACVKCGQASESFHPLAKYCGAACRATGNNDALSKARSIARKQARGCGKCGVCGVEFIRSRKDQVFCTPRCSSVQAKRAYNARIGHKPTASFYK